MKKIVSLLLVASCMAMSACASAPEAIAARQVDVHQFDNATCARLASDATETDRLLTREESQQRRTRTLDMIGVALVFLPVGSLVGGNHANAIAELKGQRDAVGVAMQQNHCDAEVAQAAQFAN